jgi:hypothetical protein
LPAAGYLLFAGSLLDRGGASFLLIRGTAAVFNRYHERSSFGDKAFARAERPRKSALMCA